MMRSLKTLSLALAAVAFVGFAACTSGGNKEVKEVETEVVEEAVVADTAAVVVDTVAVEVETPAAE